MKLKTLTCPHCSASIKAEIENKKSIFCTYCGQQFYLDEEITNIKITKDININKTNRTIDDARIIEAKLTANKDKRDTLIGIIFGGGIPLLLILSIVLYFSINTAISKNKGYVNAGEYSELIGKDYKTVEAHFEAAGFKNIELINLKDSGLLFWTNNKVESISIGGKTDFESVDWFDPNTKVVISYH